MALDGINLPCYVVQTPPANFSELLDVPMERVLVLRMAGYEIENARDLLERHVNASGALPDDAAIVINTIGSGQPCTGPCGELAERAAEWRFS